MDNRSQVFQLFGPHLMEAFLHMMMSSMNELRTNQGMPTLTIEQVYNEILNDAQHLPNYEWMD